MGAAGAGLASALGPVAGWALSPRFLGSGAHWRAVRFFAWLTLCPNWTCLPQTSQVPVPANFPNPLYETSVLLYHGARHPPGEFALIRRTVACAGLQAPEVYNTTDLPVMQGPARYLPASLRTLR